MFARYLWFQLPGWVLVGVLGAAAARWWQLSPALPWTLVALWALKDLVLFPFLRIAYEPQDPTAPASLVGTRAVADGALSPSGYVRLGAELWRAELVAGARELPAGSPVRVRGLHGLTLLVEAESGDQRGDGAPS